MPLEPHLTDRPLTNGYADAEKERYYPSGARSGASPLKEAVETLWKGRWMMVAACVLTVGAVAGYVFTVAPEYEATSLLSVELNGDPVQQRLQLGLEQDFGMGNRSLDNELWALSQSVAITEYVADELFRLQTVPETGKPITILEDKDGNPLSREQVANRLPSRLRLDQAARGVSAIRVVGVSAIPEEAALIANLYSEAYIERTQASSRARIFASRTFLEEQEQKLQADLASMEDQIGEFMSREGAAALDQEATQTVNQIAQLQAMRDDARIELGMKGATLASLEGELAEIEPKLVQRVASGVQEELDRVLRSIADLELQGQQIHQQNPDLRNRAASDRNELVQLELAQLNDRIKNQRTRASELSKQYVDEVLSIGGFDPGEGGGAGFSFIAQKRRQMAETRIEISGLEAKLTTIAQRLVDYDLKLREIPGQAIQLAQLRRAQQSAERLYVLITEKLQQIRIAEKAEIGYAEIIRPATTPNKPVRPQKARNLFLALVFGLMAGGGLVYGRRHLDSRLHQPQNLKDLGYSVMGVVPDMKKFVKETFKGAKTSQAHGRELNTMLPVMFEPLSSYAEAYRRLRTNIQFSRPDVVVQTILVTSGEAGEGKTTTVLNLAFAMAQANRRTVIIDADLRRPTLHSMLSLKRDPGLTDLLFHNEPFRPERYETSFENLYVIPAGAAVPNPSEVLGSKRMREFVEKLQAEFDVIIFDTPPVLAFSDGMLLSTQCDATIIVAAAEQTDIRSFRESVEILEGVGAHVIGGVLNKFDPRAQGVVGYPYGGGYYYERYYEHGK